MKQLNDRAPIINDIDELINFYRTDKAILKRQPDFKNWQGDKLHKEILDDLFKKDNIEFQLKFENACFVAGTLINTDKGMVPIQDIKVGDMVLSKPEDGIGKPVYKPVLKTFIHEDKEIWIVELAKNTAMIDAKGDILDYQLLENSKLYCSFLSTANHPVWVVGSMEHPNADIEFYEHPHWKRVDELRQYEIVVNHHGVMYTVERAQPTYQVKNDKIDANPNYYWYQKHYHEDYKQDYVQDAEDYMVDSEQDYKGIGYIYDIGFYQNNGRIGEYVKNSQNEITYFNQSNDKFVTTVYNFEVADNHTYFIGNAGIWVHNDECENKTIEALTGKEAATGQVTKSVSVYIPENNKSGFTKQVKEKFEKIMSDLLQYKKIADKEGYLKNQAELDEVRSESVVAVVDGNFKEKGVNYTGKKTTKEIDPVTGEEIKTVEKVSKTSDGKANWQRIQQLYMGSFTQFTTASKNLWSTASGGKIIEFMLGGMNVIKGSGGGAFAKAIGDVLHTFKVTADGKITFSNMFTDIKAQYGAGYSDLVNYSIYNRYKKDFSELTDLQKKIDDEYVNLPKDKEARMLKEAEIKAMENELKEKSEFAFDFKKKQVDENKNLSNTEKENLKLEIEKAEKKYLADYSSDATTRKVIKELAGTASLLEFHNGALSFSLAPSLRWLPSEANLADPIKLNAYNKTLADNARYMADALAEVANNKDFIKNMTTKEKQAFFEDQAGFDILKAGGSRWDPRTTGDWWSSHMYISIPKIETFTMPDKITGELVTRNRFDSSGFYALEKKGDTYEVKLKTREEVLKELDPSKPSHQGLLKALKELENSSAQNQLVSTLPTSAYHPSMDTNQIQSVLEALYQKSQTMITSLDTTLPLENQATQAVQRLNMLLVETQGQLTDAFLQQAFEKLLPQQSLQQFIEVSQTKGLAEDGLWHDVIKSVSHYCERDSVGCFVRGTVVSVDTEDRIQNIDKIKVGDNVLSRPETGEDRVSYQPVLQTFIHQDKAIWLLKAEKTTEMFDKDENRIDYQCYKSAGDIIEVLVTPNHPIWVVGCYEHPDADIEFYEQPHWKRIDELQRYEVVINPDGVMYRIERAQPVYQYLAKGESEPNPNLYWYQEHYYEDYEDDYVQGDDDFEGLISKQEFYQNGNVHDITQYESKGVSNFIESNCINYLANEEGQYIPFTRTVYNLEVANNHTYYVGVKGLWVHNTSSPSQMLLQTARDIANGVTPISDHQLQSMYQVAKQYWLDAGATTEQMANISVTLGQLSQDALATTEDKLITISPNAAGWGWFVDNTPNLNEEFTLGKNSYQANTGSKAEHKIDLLTVLIHEMGNVLGVGHKVEDDIMTLRLNAGQRRLPNAKDTEYLAWLNGTAITNATQTNDNTATHNCFVAGTLVHTDKGLVPIEQIKVGDMVLSRPENGEGEATYKRVTNTFITENQPIWAMEILGDSEEECEYLFVTENHPIWRLDSNILDYSKGRWTKVSEISDHNDVIGGTDNRGLIAFNNYPLMRSKENEKVFFQIYAEYDAGVLLDLNEYKQGKLKVIETIYGDEHNTINNEDENGCLITLPFIDTVYNIEVEDYHTYYVGRNGIWVHNCDPSTIRPTLTNNDFTNQGDNWLTTGDIRFDSRTQSATLSETANTQTNGKAERVIRTLMELWHNQHEFVSSEHRKQELTRFFNFYNTVRPHSSLTKKDEITGKTLTFTPYEWLEFYFKQSVNNG